MKIQDRTLGVATAVATLIGLLVLSLSSAYGETGWGVSPPFHLDTRGGITGTVVDAFNWDEFGREWGVRGARIVARNLSTGDTTSTSSSPTGSFLIPVPGDATYRCTFAHVGYRTKTITTPYIEAGTEYDLPRADSKLETKTVLLVHGLFSSGQAWTQDGYDFPGALAVAGDSFYVPEPVSLVSGGTAGWLSPAGGVNPQADRLGNYLQTLDGQGIRSVHIVAHSMGGLVARQYIRSPAGQGKVKNLVMLGTPNHGSELATAASLFILMIEGAVFYYTGLPLFYVPPAGQDLVPNCPRLRDLNYGGGNGITNWGCPDHPNETTLDSHTTFHTYAGTVYHWNPLTSCNPSRWIIGDLLAGLTSWPPWPWPACNNDFIVPVSSVPLCKGSSEPPDNVRNWTDEDWNCNTQHMRDLCPSMTQDPCVVRAVASMLGDPQSRPSGERSGAPGREDQATGQNIGFDLVRLVPGGNASVTFACGAADSLRFRAGLLAGEVTLALRDPAGRYITPDTAAVDPQIDYDETDNMLWYTIRDGLPGDWEVMADAEASVDSAMVLLTGTEYGEVALVIEVENGEVVPGVDQRVEATLLYGEGVLPGQLVVGTVTGPDSVSHPVTFVDDGTGGDEVADDGTYTCLFGDNLLTGQYDIAVHASGTYGGGSVLNRRGGRPYFVAARPDLVLRPEDIELSHAWDDGELVVNVAVTVRNLGLEAADSVRVQFLVQESGLAFAETTLVAFESGEEGFLTAEWIAGHELPEYNLGGRVTVTGSALEGDILNNEAYRAFEAAGVAEDPPAEEPAPNAGDVATLRARLEVFPNPFRSMTTLRFVLATKEHVELTVFDVDGRQIRELRSGDVDGGIHLVVWDGRDDSGRRVPAGAYFARLQTGSGVRADRVIMIQ